MLKIIICNSKAKEIQYLLNVIKTVLSNVKTRCELTYCSNAEKVLSNQNDSMNLYDIIFLDAQDEQCLYAAKRIRQKNFYVSIIFTADPDQNIFDLLQYRPSAVINDVEDKKQILNALQYAYNEQRQLRPYFTVKNKDTLMRIPFSDIIYFESKLRVVVLYTKKQAIEFYSKLGDVLPLLPQDTFVRCHQSYIVNLAQVNSLDKANRCFNTGLGKNIEISKSYYTEVLSKFDEFLRI